MSSNPVQTRPLERVASRRNVIRGAAWTTAAVTVVVATPNIAAASHHTLTGALTTSAKNPIPVKFNDPVTSSIKHVKWQDLHLTNTGTVPLDDLRIRITLSENAPTNVVFTVVSEGGTWATSGSGTTFEASYSGAQEPLAVGQMLTFTPDFKGANNSGGTMKVEFYSGAIKLGEVSGTWKPS